MLESFLEFFLGIQFTTPADFLLKLLVVYLALPYLIFHGIAFILLQLRRDEKMPFAVWFHIQLCKAVLILMSLLSIHFFFVIRNTSLGFLRWSEFPWSRDNCYLMLSPNLASFILCILAYWLIQDRLKKIIR